MRKIYTGQALIEVLVALGVVLLLATALIVGTTASLKAVRFSKTKDEAVKYLQEGVELTRKLRNDDWVAFQQMDGLWCIDSTGTWSEAVVSCPFDINQLFQRSVKFTWDETNGRMDVVVTVGWTDGPDVHTTELETYFTKWQ